MHLLHPCELVVATGVMIPSGDQAAEIQQKSWKKIQSIHVILLSTILDFKLCFFSNFFTDPSPVSKLWLVTRLVALFTTLPPVNNMEFET